MLPMPFFYFCFISEFLENTSYLFDVESFSMEFLSSLFKRNCVIPLCKFVDHNGWIRTINNHFGNRNMTKKKSEITCALCRKIIIDKEQTKNQERMIVVDLLVGVA
jgi:hypothetical protein